MVGFKRIFQNVKVTMRSGFCVFWWRVLSFRMLNFYSIFLFFLVYGRNVDLLFTIENFWNCKRGQRRNTYSILWSVLFCILPGFFRVNRGLNYVVFFYYLRVPFYGYDIIDILSLYLLLFRLFFFFWCYKQCHDEHFHLVSVAHFFVAFWWIPLVELVGQRHAFLKERKLGSAWFLVIFKN